MKDKNDCDLIIKRFSILTQITSHLLDHRILTSSSPKTAVQDKKEGSWICYLENFKKGKLLAKFSLINDIVCSVHIFKLHCGCILFMFDMAP